MVATSYYLGFNGHSGLVPGHRAPFLTTGLCNTLVGVGAGEALTSGGENTVVGRARLWSDATQQAVLSDDQALVKKNQVLKMAPESFRLRTMVSSATFAWPALNLCRFPCVARTMYRLVPCRFLAVGTIWF